MFSKHFKKGIYHLPKPRYLSFSSDYLLVDKSKNSIIGKRVKRRKNRLNDFHCISFCDFSD